MQDVMVEDESSNTSCTGRAIHTPTTPGLITRTYTLLKHCQTFTFLTPLRLDDQQYKRTLEFPKRILIPTSHWLFNTSQHPRQSTVHFVLTIRIRFTPSTISSTAQRCPTLLPPFSFHPAHLPLPTALATPPTSSPPLLPTAQQARKWPFPTNR